MFYENHIIYSPDYLKIINGIINEYYSLKDYYNDQINDYFNNIYITFYTKVKPDSIYSTIRDKDKFYISMSIKEMRNIIKNCYDADPFTNDLIVNVIRYLPRNFFDDLGLNIIFKSDALNIKTPRCVPNNRDQIIILDDLRSLDNFIEKYKDKLFNYEFRKLCYITMRLNCSKEILNSIEYITGNSDCTKFLLKDKGSIVFTNMIGLNSNLSEINKQRQLYTKTLYDSTKDERYLSDDVLYKIILTRNLDDWMEIFSNIKFFDNSKILNIIKSHRSISNLMGVR